MDIIITDNGFDRTIIKGVKIYKSTYCSYFANKLVFANGEVAINSRDIVYLNGKVIVYKNNVLIGKKHLKSWTISDLEATFKNNNKK